MVNLVLYSSLEVFKGLDGALGNLIQWAASMLPHGRGLELEGFQVPPTQAILCFFIISI